MTDSSSSRSTAGSSSPMSASMRCGSASRPGSCSSRPSPGGDAADGRRCRNAPGGDRGRGGGDERRRGAQREPRLPSGARSGRAQRGVPVGLRRLWIADVERRLLAPRHAPTWQAADVSEHHASLDAIERHQAQEAHDLVAGHVAKALAYWRTGSGDAERAPRRIGDGDGPHRERHWTERRQTRRIGRCASERSSAQRASTPRPPRQAPAGPVASGGSRVDHP